MSHALLSEFRRMGQVAEQTRHLLLQHHHQRPLTPSQRQGVSATLRHLAAVREGFQLSLRRESAAPDELRAIVRHTLYTLDWHLLEELGWEMTPSDEVEPLRGQLLAFAHATVALVMLPMLPPSAVSDPSSAHYRDLHTPRRPGEWLERIEELEGTLARLQAQAQEAPSPLALRRTHAYFDASAWLIRTHLQQFGD